MPPQAILTREKIGHAQRWELPDVTPADARREAEEAARPTVRELEDMAEQARQEGYARGLREGREAAREEMASATARLAGLCDALARPLDEVDEQVESELAQLAVLIARRVVGHALRTQPEQLVPRVRELIGHLPAASRQVIIHVHPDEMRLLREHLPEADDRGWRIEEAADLQPGDCRIDTEHSRIDGRVQTRLDAVVGAILDEDEHPSPEADTGDDGVPGP